MDFFTVPIITFRVLYCFFIIEHGRRKILHFNVTEHPTGPWIMRQLREAFPEACPYRYAILDRDAKLGKDVKSPFLCRTFFEADTDQRLILCRESELAFISTECVELFALQLIGDPLIPGI